MPLLRRLALLVEYDGTDFSGSQLQPGRRTVQGALEAALAQYDGEGRRVALAGRTDAGVHATGQVAAIETARADSEETARDALNHFLDEDVAILAACEVGGAFDPRRDAVARRYLYRILDGRVRSPLSRRNAWQLDRMLDHQAMAYAAALLPRERRDWSAFAGPLEAGRTPVRTLHGLGVRRAGAHEIEIAMEADAFLPHQVRRTVGALERVGAGALAPEAFADLVNAEPGGVRWSAPPQGLTLEAVRYPPGSVGWDAEVWDAESSSERESTRRATPAGARGTSSRAQGA